MKSSEILRKAAANIERGINDENGACWAVKKLLMRSGIKYNEATDLAYFWDKGGPMRHMMACFGHPMEGTWPENYYDNGPRLIGLCLAAAIAESEGD